MPSGEEAGHGWTGDATAPGQSSVPAACRTSTRRDNVIVLSPRGAMSSYPQGMQMPGGHASAATAVAERARADAGNCRVAEQSGNAAGSPLPGFKAGEGP